MSKYQEIQKQFHSLLEADLAYWERLGDTQKTLRLGFADFLGMDANSPLAEGDSCPPLYFGGKPNPFGGKSADETTREGNELVFTLSLVLDPSERAFPPNAVKFRCRTKYVDSLYMFFLEGEDGTYTTVSDGDFSPIYERLYAECNKILSKYNRL